MQPQQFSSPSGGNQIRQKRLLLTDRIRKLSREYVISAKRDQKQQSMGGLEEFQTSSGRDLPIDIQSDPISTSVSHNLGAVTAMRRLQQAVRIDQQKPGFKEYLKQLGMIDYTQNQCKQLCTLLCQPKDELSLYQGVIGLRKLLTVDTGNRVGQEIIKSGALSVIVGIAATDYAKQLRHEAVWCISNIASGPSSHCKALCQYKAHDTLLNIIGQQLDAHNQALVEKALYGLANLIADENSFYRRYLQERGIQDRLIYIISQTKNLSLVRRAAWALSSLCSLVNLFEPPAQVENAAFALAKLVSDSSTLDNDTLLDCLQAVHIMLKSKQSLVSLLGQNEVFVERILYLMKDKNYQKNRNLAFKIAELLVQQPNVAKVFQEQGVVELVGKQLHVQESDAIRGQMCTLITKVYSHSTPAKFLQGHPNISNWLAATLETQTSLMIRSTVWGMLGCLIKQETDIGTLFKLIQQKGLIKELGQDLAEKEFTLTSDCLKVLGLLLWLASRFSPRHLQLWKYQLQSDGMVQILEDFVNLPSRVSQQAESILQTFFQHQENQYPI